MITPCVNLCKLDTKTNQCLGCRRTIEEISNWTRLTDQERSVIMERLFDETQYTGNISWVS